MEKRSLSKCHESDIATGILILVVTTAETCRAELLSCLNLGAKEPTYSLIVVCNSLE